MDETASAEVVLAPRPGFQTGHKRFGGRPRGAKNVRTATAREIAARLRIDPLEWLLLAARTGRLKNDDGSVTKISSSDRITAAKNALPFVHIKRSSLSVQGRIESDLRSQHMDMTRIMLDPILAEAAERLALAMAAEPDSSPVDVPKVYSE
jgi:hypothetical protein